MDVSEITIADFKAHFVRDFSYGATSDKVMDADITKAYTEAKANFNPALFSSDDQLIIAFLYLAAHYLVIDFQNSNSGLNQAALGLLASRSVGSVSESYSVPDTYTKDPLMAFYAKTGYGQKYLSLVLPALVGNVASAAGWTNP